MSTSILLSLLAEGEYCSGQDLAGALGVSRTAVWKQINKLAADTGLEIESVKGRGYRIPGGVDLLQEDLVKALLSAEAAALMSGLQVMDSVDSTNAEAMRQLERGSGKGWAFTAEQQMAGRGRRGRTWVSPYARNIYLSLVWEFGQGAAALEGLSLAVGVAVARALHSTGIDEVQLKWPNDVLHGGAKLGGILLEMVGDVAGPCQVVVGVGLNVAMPAETAGDIDQEWTDLERIAGDERPQRSGLLAALLNELFPLLATFEDGGFAPWREPWQQLDAFADEPVVLLAGDKRTGGVARGVDDRGALQLETATGVQTIYGGELSLRQAS